MSAASTVQPPERPGHESRVKMDLRVFSGMHAGAEVRLPERGILMIGQADDCDLIISDPGIAPHHCVLTLIGDQVLLRTLEGHVDIEGTDWGSGNMALEHFAVVRLGEVTLAVGPHWSERWRQLAGEDVPADEDEEQLTKRRKRVLLMSGLLLVVAALVLFGGWHLMRQPTPVAQGIDSDLAQARDIIKAMSLPRVAASEDGSGILVLRGEVDTARQLTALKQHIKDAGLMADLRVRDRDSVVKAVHDIFSVNGHEVRVHMEKDGWEVAVGGHFGGADLDRIKHNVLASADMQHLNDDMLKRLRLGLVDYDAHAKPPPKQDPNKVIERVYVSKDMAYVVTHDGSHYYPGSTLPQGGVFETAYPDGTIVLKRDGRYMQLTKATRYRTLAPLDTHAGQPMPAPASSLPVAVPLEEAGPGETTPGAHEIVPISSKLAGKSHHVH